MSFSVCFRFLHRGKWFVLGLIALLNLSIKARATCSDDFSEGNYLKAEDFNFQVLGEEHSETVVLIHGLGGRLENWRYFDADVAYRLSKTHRVLVYDQRGHGDTSGKDSDYSSKAMAGDLRVLMDHLGIKKAHLIGHSMGARTAIRFAYEYPDRVGGVVLEDMHMKSLARAKYLQRDIELNDLYSTFKQEFQNQEEAFNHFLEKLPEHHAEGLALNHLREDRDGKWRLQGYIYYHAQGLLEDLTEVMKSTKAPLLFIAGDPERKGTVLRDVGVDHIKENKPEARIEVVRWARHGVHIDQFSVFMKLVESFFREVDQEK